MSNLELIKKFRASLGLPPAMPITALPSTQKLLRHSNEKFLEVILKDVPFWRRGLSSFQVNKLDRLYLYLRDDMYEGTSYRVRRALKLIGLTVRFTAKEVWQYIIWSQGDDVVFLWHLLVGKYGIPTPETVTVEQQTIMTGIAQLSMFATLKELDRILPKPQGLRKDPALVKAHAEIQGLKRAYQRSYRFGPEAFKPYTQSQRLPVPYGKSLILQKAPVKVASIQQDKQKNALKFRPRGYTSNNTTISAPYSVKEQTKELEEREQKPLCLKRYEEIVAVEQNLEQTLQSIAFRNCKKNYRSDEHRQEVIAKLHEQVKCHMREFRKYSEKYRLRPLISFLSDASQNKHPVSDHRGIVEAINKELEELKTKEKMEAMSSCKEKSRKLFHAPEQHKPFKFDYSKIYMVAKVPSAEFLQVVKQEIEHGLAFEKQQYSDDNCSCYSKETSPPPEVVKEDFYDCNDLMLMHNMLRDALEYLALNTKLLLPGFPDVHKFIA